MIELTCSNSDLDNASKIVLNGGIVIFPTDTVYGLGCDPFNNISVERIFTIKKLSDKPIPVLSNYINSVSKLVGRIHSCASCAPLTFLVTRFR